MIKDGERKLAYIASITGISPILNADKIEVANIKGWQVVVKKNEFKVGDKVVYIEIDSKVPATMECFDFLADRKFKVKTIKLRGQVSQGLVMPLSILPKGNYEVDDDVTEVLGITKIEEERAEDERVDSNMARMYTYHKALMKKRWFKRMMRYEWFRKFAFKYLIPKKRKGGFPTCFPGVNKTDQERCENLDWDKVCELGGDYVVTTKIDGTSTTVIVDQTKRKEEDWVLSRNVRQFESSVNFHDKTGEDNVYWQAVEKYHLFDFLREVIKIYDADWAAIQGETAGLSEKGSPLQNNPHKFTELRFFGFDLIVAGHGKIDIQEAAQIAESHGVPWVPIVNTNYVLPTDFQAFKESANGPCEAPGAFGLREGYVYRKNGDPNFSFKNISNDYLLKKFNK